MTKMPFWGYSYLLNASGCDHKALTSADTISRFVKELVDKIEMKAYGEPQIVHFGEGNKEGYTLVQLIETSNICGHFVNETDEIYLDIFSCKEFKEKDALAVFQKYFDPTNWSSDFVIRQAPPAVR